MKLKYIRWVLVIILCAFSGCAASQSAVEEQHSTSHAPANVTVEAQEVVPERKPQAKIPASDSQGTYKGKQSITPKEERYAREDTVAPDGYGLSRGWGDEDVLEDENVESGGVGDGIVHPFQATRTATTSTVAPLADGYGDSEPLFHAYVPTDSATVSTTVSGASSGIPARLDTTPATSASAQGDAFTLNGDDLDLHEVIHTVGRVLGYNYVVDPRVSGRINIRSNQKIAREDLFSVFESLLKINNATILKRGDFYHIVPLATTKQEPLTPYRIPGKDVPDQDRYLMQIVVLQHISAEEMAKILKPFVSPQGGDIISNDTVMIILDFASNIKKLMSLIDLFDVSMFERLHVQLYESKYADVEELASDLRQLTAILDAQILRYPEEWLWFHRRWRTADKRLERLTQTPGAPSAR